MFNPRLCWPMAFFAFLSKDTFQSRPSYRPMRKSRGPRGLSGRLRYTWATICVAVSRLQTSTDPHVTLSRLKTHQWTYKDAIYVLHVALWIFWLIIMKAPLLLRLAIPIFYLTAIGELSSPVSSRYPSISPALLLASSPCHFTIVSIFF